MPIYEYRCHACRHPFEVFHMAGAEQDGAVCPSCGAKDPQKLISASAAVSHGSRSAPMCAAAQGGGCSAGPGGPV